MNDQAVAALAGLGGIYQRGGLLVRVSTDVKPPKGIKRPKASPRIEQLPRASLRELLADAATWRQPTNGGGSKSCNPPDWSVKAVAARGQWKSLPLLEGIVECPVLRADGSVLQTPGYDPMTGLLYRPNADFPIVPERPTKDDVAKAVGDLLEVVADFPFASDCHKAAWLAGVLTPIARFAFDGPAPLFLIDANTRGSGKSLLADTISVIATGRPMARAVAPPNDSECRKVISSAALAGEPLMLFDNVSGEFGWPSLDAALTAVRWTDRVLSTNTMLRVDLSTIWFATGNNTSVAGDTARRTVHIRLRSPEQSPEERSDFRHPDLLGWIRRNRPRLAVAIVAVLHGYFAAGRPDMRLRPWGSFEAWSDTVRSAIAWVGLPDPGQTRQELSSANDEVNALGRLIDMVGEADPFGHGIAAKDILRMANENDALEDAVMELAPGQDGKPPTAKSLGKRLASLRGRVVDGRALDCKPSNLGKLWLVQKSGFRGFEALEGFISSQTREEKNLEGDKINPSNTANPLPADSDDESEVIEWRG